MFHMKDGQYVFDRSRGKLAHRWCQNACWNAMVAGMDVAVSNTFTQKWEMQPYLDFAKDTGHEVIIETMTGQWPSIHPVPEDVMKAMRDRWEE